MTVAAAPNVSGFAVLFDGASIRRICIDPARRSSSLLPDLAHRPFIHSVGSATTAPPRLADTLHRGRTGRLGRDSEVVALFRGTCQDRGR